MAIYRNVQLSFWTDNKVEDDFTPEDKYFYLYLLTNPQTNICGCYEVSYSQLTNQTGYNKDSVIRLLDRFENIHGIIKFDKKTKEILILNWYKYNWSKSEKTLVGVENVAKHIKSKEFQKYIYSVIENIRKGSVENGHICPMEASDSDTDTDSDSVNNNIKDIEKEEQLKNNFQIIYDSYPKKVGRTEGYTRYKAWVTKGRDINGKRIKLTNREIWQAIADYKREKEETNTELQYYKNFDVFMNKPVLDYILRRREEQECRT